MNTTAKRIFVPLAVIIGVWLFVPAALAAKNGSLDKAREAASHSDWDQALELAQQAVKEAPDDADAWAFLGDAQLTSGDTAQAVTSYEKSVGVEAKQPLAVLGLTRLYLRSNRVPDAERVVSSAEAKDKKGKFDEIKVARGMIFAAQGNMPEATKILASATAKNPKNPLYPQILARIYEDKNVYDLAEKYFADAWALKPGDPQIAFEYGLVLQQQKKYDEALNLFKQVQEKDPNNKSVDFLIGRLYFAAKRYAEAATQFERAVEKRPDHFLSQYLLGRSYLEFSKAEKKNYYPQAVVALRKATELRPERADARNDLAEAVMGLGWVYYQRAVTDSTVDQKVMLDSALMTTREAAQLDTSVTGVNGQMARIFFKQGRFDSSAAYSRLQLARTPDDETEFQRLVSALQRQKDQPGLVEVLAPKFGQYDWTAPRTPGEPATDKRDKFLERFGGAYANALNETGRKSDARDALKTMLAYKPDWCDGHSLNAYMYLVAQRYAEAVTVLQQAVKSCPSDGDLWLSLGDSYYFSNPKDKDNVERAKNAYQRACNLGARDGCEKLQQLTQPRE